MSPTKPTSTATLSAAVFAAALTAAAVTPSAQAAETIRFGMQPWPGVTVKTEVAKQLLDVLGYPAEIRQLDPQFVYQGLRSDDVDVTLGAWMPAHKPMLQPLLDRGEAVQYAINLEGALQGLTVPQYVCDDGVTSVADLAAHGDRFDHTIYAIGAGAAMTEAFQEAVAADYQGLGDWEVLPSSTTGMLSQVERQTRKQGAIVFHGWKPHWMAVQYDLCFLTDDADDSTVASVPSTVWTITADGWAEANSQPALFLKQMQVASAVQSQWIYEFSHEERPVDEVAAEWIASQPEELTAWLDGVAASDGTPGLETVTEAFAR